jgi:DNA polymerase-3 subunit epsilon
MENGTLLTALPIKHGRYVIVDTETTGVNPEKNNIIELACVEISKGRITGEQFHCYIRPRHKIDLKAQAKHKLHPSFYEDYFQDVYASDKSTLENFLKFIGNSIIFAHNATFDIDFLNSELRYWKLPTIPKGRFRCTMRIFKKVFGNIDHRLQKYCSLAKCCEFFNIKTSKDNFHSAIFDSFVTARLVCKIYEFIEDYNIDLSNLQKTKLALLSAEKFYNVQNIGELNPNNKTSIDTTAFYGIHKENINPNKLEDCQQDEPQTIDPEDLMGIIEEHGGFIESYMNDEEGGGGGIKAEQDVNEIDINVIENCEKDEHTQLEEKEDEVNIKCVYEMMQLAQPKTEEGKEDNITLTGDEIAGIEDFLNSI